MEEKFLCNEFQSSFIVKSSTSWRAFHFTMKPWEMRKLRGREFTKGIKLLEWNIANISCIFVLSACVSASFFKQELNYLWCDLTLIFLSSLSLLCCFMQWLISSILWGWHTTPSSLLEPELFTVYCRLWTQWIWIGRRVSSPCSTKSVSMNNLDFKTCERYEPPRTV